ncbi:amidohydrolase family protein [Solwaraspora sp. WMMB335]|uniref:amidohydrolase family protein n=1 Tax=Solwaraspora sp. WMMB335 TaxID=3404118 RepID=UPI003B92AA61
MIFDFHARLTAAPDAVPAMLATMAGTGIARAAVSAGGVVDLDRLSDLIVEGGRADVAVDNERVRRDCARSGGLLLPFYFADPYRDVADYRRVAPSYRGLEISPAVHGFRLDDPPVSELVAVAGDVGHPVYLVCLGRPGARTTDLVALARRFPGVTFVSGHCGHTGLDAAGLALIAPLPNVVVETSGCFTAVARLAVHRLGADRVLFGTEYPLQHPEVELAKLTALDLTATELHQVTSGNAARLLGEESPVD